MPDSKKHHKNCGDSIKDRGFHALPPEIMTEVYYCACDEARHDSLQLRVLSFGLLQDGDVGNCTCGTPIRRKRSAKRGSEWRLSNLGSILTSTTTRRTKPFSKAANAASLSPSIA